jgi:hypothetical protein
MPQPKIPGTKSQGNYSACEADRHTLSQIETPPDSRIDGREQAGLLAS